MTRALSSGSASVNGVLWQDPSLLPEIGAAGKRHKTGGKTIKWRLAEETPIAILIGSQPLAVMMATPADFEDFAVGFLLAEGFVADRGAIKSVLVLPTENGFCLDVALDGPPLRALPQRGMEGRSGCGLCGMNNLTDVTLNLPHRQRAPLQPSSVCTAFDQLAELQPLKQENRSVHGAGFARADGKMLLVREDVGRHSALDKLIGALARKNINPASGFAVMSSRGSFELVQKAAMAGLGGLATRSAPTRLACTLAQKAGLPLFALARPGVVRF